MKNSVLAQFTLAQVLIGGGGAITFLFSFLDFSRGFGANAWDTDVFAFASTVPAILGLVAAVWIGLEIAEIDLPDDVLTFNAAQLKVTWGISAAGIMLSWYGANEDKAIGFWLMLLGSLAMAVGAVMSLLGVGNDPLGTRSESASESFEPFDPSVSAHAADAVDDPGAPPTT